MTDDLHFSPLPQDIKTENIPRANVAEAITSQKIVSDDEGDAFYFRQLENQGIDLNQAQIEAVRHSEGPVLTLAGAGSGKTSVLVCRTGYLMSVLGVEGRNIWLVTFTKKAAGEMKNRIANLPGIDTEEVRRIQASTFHSFFLTLLRSRGYNQKILSSERFKHMILQRIMRDLGEEESFQPEEVLALLSFYKMNIIAVSDMPEKTATQKLVKTISKKYEQWKEENHQLDFDDILFHSYDRLREDSSLLNALQRRFTYIMVDEFQDTNVLQYELIKMIAGSNPNLFVVGDDDQTIYSFNGARHDIILGFDRDFPGTKTVTLDINYRSTDHIVGLGNEVIRYNQQRKRKTLKATKESEEQPQFIRPGSTDEEAEKVVANIKAKVTNKEVRYEDIAILFRTTSVSRAIFEQLTLQDIPFTHYSMGEQTFYEKWPVKAVVSHLSLALNPKKLNALEEVVPTLYINRERGMEIIRLFQSEQPQEDPLLHLTLLPEIKPFQKQKVEERVKLIKQLAAMKPIDAIQRIRHDFYDQFLKAKGEEDESLHKQTVKEELDELESSAKRFQTLKEFLSFVQQMIIKHREMGREKSSAQEDKVSLMTIHRAKGLEFPIVYVIGMSETVLPHISAMEAWKMGDMLVKEKATDKANSALEEERRLTYVAMTRAKENLYISSPAYYRGKTVNTSRFITDVFQERKASSKDKRRVATHSSAPQEKVRAWICTSDDCIAWSRIQMSDETEQEAKECPMCHATMKKGVKEV